VVIVMIITSCNFQGCFSLHWNFLSFICFLHEECFWILPSCLASHCMATCAAIFLMSTLCVTTFYCYCSM
jgi:hypothetical protein